MKSSTRQKPATSALYADVISHLHASTRSERNVSDTWQHTLRAKGTVYSQAELERMLSLGCRVNSWIRNLAYYIDRNIVDLSDPLIARLIELGNSDVGRPYKDIEIGGVRYSSLLFYTVPLAAEIIRALDAAGIARPRILEIGGGYGVLMALLRAYYGARLTLYAIDLPETLCIQEWYLRSCFPDVATSYKARNQEVDFVEGGFNFVNAHVYAAQPFAIDAAINFDSMCEMPSHVVAAYIEFIEANISPGGVFVFQNGHGHSNDAIVEASEYPFDARWTVRHASLRHLYETMSNSFMPRLILQRSGQSKDLAVRKTVLRTIHQLGHGSGLGQTSRATSVLLAAMDRPSVPDATAFVRAQGLHEVAAAMDRLAGNLYLERQAAKPNAALKGNSELEALVAATTRFQMDIIALMEEVGARGIEHARAGRDRIVGELAAAASEGRTSDYWVGFVASALYPLGGAGAATDLVVGRARGTSSELWQVRFAYLLTRYGARAEARSLLSSLRAPEDLEWSLELKLCELFAANGWPERTAKLLRRQAEAPVTALNAAAVGKTLARVGDAQAVVEYVGRIAETFGAGAWNIVFDVLATYLDNPERGGSLPAPLERLVRAGEDQPGAGVWVAAILNRIGKRAEAARLVSATLAGIAEDYFALGRAGRILYWGGLLDVADDLLERSCLLRADNFLHAQYVGNIRFASSAWSKAARNYSTVLAAKPYLKHVRARRAYCLLPDPIRGAGIFGQPEEMDMMFPQEQDYYHDIGPTYK